MGRLTIKKRFECFKPDEEVTTVCVDGYTQICEADDYFAKEQHYFLVGEAVEKLKKYEDAEEQGFLAPVVHGKWEKEKDDLLGLQAIRCSICHEEYFFEDEEDVVLMNYNYCPNCGKPMDLEEG